jgi:hypothetical protein
LTRSVAGAIDTAIAEVDELQIEGDYFVLILF